MAISFTFIDDFLRDYFQYRNCISTSRMLEQETTKLSLERYRADDIIEQLTVYIHQFDISNLIDYWTQIEQRLLLILGIHSPRLLSVFTKIRLNLYRSYLIHAVQSSRMDKITEFYERLGKILQQSSEWSKDWFALPFIPNPEENITFQIYFSKQWNELFWISLQNFLSTAFYHSTLPTICSLEKEEYEQSNLSIELPTHLSISEQRPSSNRTILSKLREKFSTENQRQ